MVLYLSMAIIAICVLWGLLNPDGFGAATTAAMNFTT